jgi:hypothetical protein
MNSIDKDKAQAGLFFIYKAVFPGIVCKIARNVAEYIKVLYVQE